MTHQAISLHPGSSVSRRWGLLCAVAILMLMQQTAHATQWKWLDAQGKVQYSDRPPPNDVPDKNILKRPARLVANSKSAATASSASSTPVLNAPVVDPELDKKKREKEASEDRKRKAEEDKQQQVRADNCQKARKYEKALGQGYRVSRVNDKGEREFLDEKGLAEENSRVKSVISSNCY